MESGSESRSTQSSTSTDSRGSSQYGTPADCTIKIDGNEITADISSVLLEQFVDKHHVLQVRIRHRGLAEGDTEFQAVGGYTGFLGKALGLEIRPVGDVVDQERKLEFVGLVTEVRFENTVDGVNVLLLRANSPTVAMDSLRKTKVSAAGGDCADIVGTILGNHPVTQGRLEGAAITTASNSLNVEVDSVVQYMETDYDYVLRLAAEHKMFAFYDGTAFNMEKAATNDEQELLWRETLGSFSVGLATVPLSYRGTVWNPRDKAAITGQADKSAIRSALSTLSKKSVDSSEKVFTTTGVSRLPRHADQAAVDKALGGNVEGAVFDAVTCRGHSVVPAVKVGSCVRVRGMADLDGQYWVTAVTHRIDESGKYFNEFVCRPLELALPQPRPERHPYALFQTGVVTDNEDPDDLGRVKVRLSWHGPDEETAFLRMMSPDAGSGRGWFILPETGDEVLVAYERGNPDAPVVLGHLYNGTDKPPLPSSECLDGGKVIKKVFRSRTGNEILFDDTAGDESITITQGDGKNSIMLALNGPKIVVETDGDLVMKAGTIAFETTTGDISVKSSGAIKVESTGDMELKAGGNFKSEGGMNYEAKGGIAFKASGAQSSVEGSAMTEIKGGIVKIN